MGENRVSCSYHVLWTFFFFTKYNCSYRFFVAQIKLFSHLLFVYAGGGGAIKKEKNIGKRPVSLPLVPMLKRDQHFRPIVHAM